MESVFEDKNGAQFMTMRAYDMPAFFASQVTNGPIKSIFMLGLHQLQTAFAYGLHDLDYCSHICSYCICEIGGTKQDNIPIIAIVAKAAWKSEKILKADVEDSPR